MLLIDHTRSYMLNHGNSDIGEPFRLDDEVAENLLERHDTLEQVEETTADEFNHIEDGTPQPAESIEDSLLNRDELAAQGDEADDGLAQGVSDVDEAEDVPEDADQPEEPESDAGDASDDDEETPVYKGGGWWHYEGESYRKADLIAAGILTK
jgi:hypothetical protein